MADSETRTRRTSRHVPTALLLILAFGAFGAIAANAFRNGAISFDESLYLIKSWWYVTGIVTPYTATDATWTTPLYFYLLGWWQSLVGDGLETARALSIGLGVLNGALLFFICRRLTGNMLAAAAGVLLLLATPTTAFFFSLALPVAAVSALHLAAIWVIVSGLGRPHAGASVAFGLICAALFFTRPSMILAVMLLVPLYIAAVGSARKLHGAIVIVTIAVASAGLIMLFPDKLASHALHLPVITPYLEQWGLLPPDLVRVDQGTTGRATMALALDRIQLADVINGFVLPFAGILALSLLLFFVAGKGLRVLWIAPLYFLALVAGHIVATAGLCTGCLPQYGATFIGAGALAGALTLAILASRARNSNTSPAAAIIGGAVIAAAMNIFAPALASRDTYMFYPAPLLDRSSTTSPAADVHTFAQWLATSSPLGEPILLIHDLPALPYGVFRAGRTFPVQNINPMETYRVMKPRYATGAPSTRESIQAAVESETLWTGETLRRWLERDYDLVLFQENKKIDQTATQEILARQFDAAATTTFRGAQLTLFKRKPAQ